MTPIWTFLQANKIAAGLGVALLLIALVTGAYFKGKAAQRNEYAALALETAKQARVASEQATSDKDERDTDFALEQAEIEDAVQNAIDTGGDPVSTYFDELRKSQTGSGQATGQ